MTQDRKLTETTTTPSITDQELDEILQEFEDKARIPILHITQKFVNPSSNDDIKLIPSVTPVDVKADPANAEEKLYPPLTREEAFSQFRCRVYYILEKDRLSFTSWMTQLINNKNRSEYEHLMLGIAYYFGLGIEKNHVESFKIFNSLQLIMNLYAKFYLGCSYLYGLGVVKNEDMGIRLLINASHTGKLSAADYMIGNCYKNEIILKKDLNKAFEYYNKAAATDLYTTIILGDCYHDGLGTNKNREQTKQLWITTSKQGAPYALHSLAFSFLNLAQEIKVHQIISRYFYNSDSIYNLAIRLEKPGVTQHIPLSAYYYRLASFNDKDGQNELNTLYKSNLEKSSVVYQWAMSNNESEYVDEKLIKEKITTLRGLLKNDSLTFNRLAIQDLDSIHYQIRKQTIRMAIKVFNTQDTELLKEVNSRLRAHLAIHFFSDTHYNPNIALAFLDNMATNTLTADESFQLGYALYNYSLRLADITATSKLFIKEAAEKGHTEAMSFAENLKIKFKHFISTSRNTSQFFASTAASSSQLQGLEEDQLSDTEDSKKINALK